jgi:hypothetical protein
MGVTPVLPSTATTAGARRRRRRPFRERRSLTFPSPTSRIQRLGQSVNLTTEPIALPCQLIPLALQLRLLVAQALAFFMLSSIVAAQLIALSTKLLDRRLRILARALAHAPVMPESTRPYKRAPANQLRTFQIHGRMMTSSSVTVAGEQT